MEDGLVYHSAVFQVLDDDALEKGRGHGVVPDAFGINDNDWPVAADPEARRLAAFDTVRSKQEIFAMKQ
jgi:hypothetical protein